MAGEGKRLGSVPPDHYELLGDSIKLREQRLVNVREHLRQAHLPRWEQANLETERSRLEEWHRAYAKLFLSLETKSAALVSPLSDLCPVTWRSLELLFSREINYKLPM